MLVRDQLVERAKDFHLILDDVSLVSSKLALSSFIFKC